MARRDRSIIAMAKSLHMTTVAEGVETEGQLGFLNTNQCDAMQGYYFSRPLPGAEMDLMLHAGTHLPPDSCHAETPQRVLLLVDDEEHILSALRARCARRLPDTQHQPAAGSAGTGGRPCRGRDPHGCAHAGHVRHELLRRIKGIYPGSCA